MNITASIYSHQVMVNGALFVRQFQLSNAPWEFQGLAKQTCVTLSQAPCSTSGHVQISVIPFAITNRIDSVNFVFIDNPPAVDIQGKYSVMQWVLIFALLCDFQEATGHCCAVLSEIDLQGDHNMNISQSMNASWKNHCSVFQNILSVYHADSVVQLYFLGIGLQFVEGQLSEVSGYLSVSLPDTAFSEGNVVIKGSLLQPVAEAFYSSSTTFSAQHKWCHTILHTYATYACARGHVAKMSGDHAALLHIVIQPIIWRVSAGLVLPEVKTYY
jgi:hypothetical protein